MKFSLKLLLAVAGLCPIWGLTAFGSNAKVGEIAPEFNSTDIEGEAVRLSEWRGRVVVLEWVNPECPFVKKHYSSGNIPALQKEATDDGVVWVCINSGASGAQGDFTADKVREWIDRHGAAPSHYLRDSTGVIGKTFGAKTTPQLFVIDATGLLVYSGAIDDIASTNVRDIPKAENYVRMALAALGNEEPIHKSQTQPYGCAVKY